MTNTVVFDFDGTLADTNAIVKDSWRYTFRVMVGNEGSEEIIDGTLGEPIIESMRRLFGEDRAEEGAQIYRTYHRSRFRGELKFFPGMPELVRELHARGYKLAVVTSRIRSSLLDALEKYELQDCFGTLVAFDDCEKHKPDPAPLLLALERLGSTVEEAVMIGDSFFDIGCANNAGVRSVKVGWAPVRADDDGSTHPDYIGHDTDEILKIILALD